VAVAYALANLVRGEPVVIDDNLDPAPGMDNPNENLTCVLGKMPPSGNLIFGAITDDDPLTFNAGQGSAALKLAVRAQACVPVDIYCSSLFGGPFCVMTKATAQYDGATGESRLIRVETYICPGP
jgi:hypothetical protein